MSELSSKARKGAKQSPSLKARALRLLSLREYSRKGLAAKLAESEARWAKLTKNASEADLEGGSDTPPAKSSALDIEVILDDFEARGWLSDERFAEALVILTNLELQKCLCGTFRHHFTTVFCNCFHLFHWFRLFHLYLINLVFLVVQLDLFLLQHRLILLHLVDLEGQLLHLIHHYQLALVGHVDLLREEEHTSELQ